MFMVKISYSYEKSMWEVAGKSVCYSRK